MNYITPTSMPGASPALSELRRQVRALDGAADVAEAGTVSLGLPPIDAALPWGGVPRAALHEITGPAGDGAALGFAVAILARLKIGRPILWCRTAAAIADHGALYGPGLAAAGVSPRRVIFVTVAKPAEAMWVLEEALRSDGLAAVVGEGARASFTESRRLQLAARGGATLALLLPPANATSAHSAALTRWHVMSAKALPPFRAWRLSLQHGRGVKPAAWHVEAKDAALCGAVAVPLAHGHLEAQTAAI